MTPVTAPPPLRIHNATMEGTRADIHDFLHCRRLALVGASRNERDFSALLLREFIRRGYDVVPVNPSASSVQGFRTFARVQDIAPPVEAALLMTPPTAAEQIVADCLAAGIRRVWLYGPGHGNAIHAAAIRLCRDHQVPVIEGHCPLMFLSGASWFHRLHGGILKLTGKYPKAPATAP